MARKRKDEQAEQKALVKAHQLADALADDPDEYKEILDELTDRQKMIARLKLRGVSQEAIAKVLKLTPARISQEVRFVRKHFINKGSSIDQSYKIGESLSIYEEVEKKAWEVYENENNQIGLDEDTPAKPNRMLQLRALDRVMNAREKQINLLMDLGLIKKAATEYEYTHKQSTLLDTLPHHLKQQISEIFVNGATVTTLEEPEPPQLEEDNDNED